MRSITIVLSGTGWDEYNWFGRIISDPNMSAETGIITVAMALFEVIWLASMVLSLFKFLEAYIQYRDRSIHPVQKQQAFQELLEPVKGILYFTLATTVIRIIVSRIFPEYAGIFNLIR